MLSGPPKLHVPRWIQLVLLPLLAFAAWVLASAIAHAILIFLISAVIAVLLNPLVHRLTRLRLSRGVAVLAVYFTFLAAVVGIGFVIGGLLVGPVRAAAHELEYEFTPQPPSGVLPAQARVNDFQGWLDQHGLGGIDIRPAGHQLVNNIEKHNISSYLSGAVSVGQTIATRVAAIIVNGILVVVISIYMLLAAPGIGRFVNRVFPPGPDGQELGAAVQRALGAYVRGQLLVSFIIGLSVGIAMEVVALVTWPDARQYAGFFAVWAMCTEAIPYVGPALGAIPPVILGFLHSPFTAVWVIVAFLFINQLEGHVVVPRVMGSALGAHPLAVIFGLLAGAEIYGLAGVLLALPLLAMGLEVASFLRGRVTLEPWGGAGLDGSGADVTVPVVVADDPRGPAPLEPAFPRDDAGSGTSTPLADRPAQHAG